MSYGCSLANATRVTKRSDDEGIDGVIDEDRLGLDSIYIKQSNRFALANLMIENNVGVSIATTY